MFTFLLHVIRGHNTFICGISWCRILLGVVSTSVNTLRLTQGWHRRKTEGCYLDAFVCLTINPSAPLFTSFRSSHPKPTKFRFTHVNFDVSINKIIGTHRHFHKATQNRSKLAGWLTYCWWRCEQRPIINSCAVSRLQHTTRKDASKIKSPGNDVGLKKFVLTVMVVTWQQVNKWEGFQLGNKWPSQFKAHWHLGAWIGVERLIKSDSKTYFSPWVQSRCLWQSLWWCCVVPVVFTSWNYDSNCDERRKIPPKQNNHKRQRSDWLTESQSCAIILYDNQFSEMEQMA